MEGGGGGWSGGGQGVVSRLVRRFHDCLGQDSTGQYSTGGGSSTVFFLTQSKKLKNARHANPMKQPCKPATTQPVSQKSEPRANFRRV